MKPVEVILLAAAVALLGAAPAWAQSDDGSEAPEILTSDLVAKQRVDEPSLTAHFVFVDSDNITQVFIDGEAQQIDPGDLITIAKQFQFQKGRRLIKVEAVDEKGNRRAKSYLVVFGEELKEGVKEPKFKWQASGNVAYDIDSNPTLDLSLPIPIGDVKLEGAVPDEDQTDTRISLQGVFAGSYGDLSGYAGLQNASYSRPEYEGLGSQVIFFGGNYKIGVSDSTYALLGGSFTDINVGGADYAQVMSFTPVYVLTGKDDEDNTKHQFGLDLANKSFADSARDPGSQYTLKWTYGATDFAGQDKFTSVFRYGTATEGTPDSEYNAFAIDLDWDLTWDSGVTFSDGYGIEKREYPNVPLEELIFADLGTVRLDYLIRISFGLGYKFNKKWSATFNFEYKTDVSNKNPYVRQIYGLTVAGAY